MDDRNEKTGGKEISLHLIRHQTSIIIFAE